MHRFAIDIVIIPPVEVIEIAVALNQRMRRVHPSAIVLDKYNCIPHISMAMGCLQAEFLDKAEIILKSVAEGSKSLELTASRIWNVETSGDDTVVALDIEGNTRLNDLHEKIVNAFRPILSHDTRVEDMFDPPPIEPSTLVWINRFIAGSSFKNFWPHITLGFGAAPSDFRVFSFKASRLAICHLGNYCTCKKILTEARLTD